MGTKLKKISAEVYGLDTKEVECFTRQLEAMGYDFSELRETIEELPKYKVFFRKYILDALDNHFPTNYVPDAAEYAKARIEISSQVDESKWGILREFLWENCKEMTITFKI